jgi:hypothetical protein
LPPDHNLNVSVNDHAAFMKRVERMRTNEEMLGLSASALPKPRATKVKGHARGPGRRAKNRLVGAPIALLTEHSQDNPAPATWFHYFDPAAMEVFVAGDFNQWKPTATPMCIGAGGEWCAEVQLPPGSYEYRFVVDGAWKDDPKAAATKPNPFGGQNAVKIVSTPL